MPQLPWGWISFGATWLLIAAVKVGWVPFFSAYVSEKGRRLATRQDIENVITEVRRVTSETEQIKAQISGDLWNRQMQWNQKRDVYGSLLGLVSEMQTEYVKLHSMYSGGITILPAREMNAPFDRLVELARDFRKAAALASIFAGSEANEAIQRYIESDASAGKPSERAAKGLMNLEQLRTQLISAAKQDLDTAGISGAASAVKVKNN